MIDFSEGSKKQHHSDHPNVLATKELVQWAIHANHSIWAVAEYGHGFRPPPDKRRQFLCRMYCRLNEEIFGRPVSRIAPEEQVWMIAIHECGRDGKFPHENLLIRPPADRQGSESKIIQKAPDLWIKLLGKRDRSRWSDLFEIRSIDFRDLPGYLSKEQWKAEIYDKLMIFPERRRSR